MENWLVIGGGGREFAIAQALAKTGERTVFVAPGNPKMAILENVTPVAIDELAFSQLAYFAKTHDVVCTVVGPEQPLSKGIVDYFEERGLAVFGPSEKAAQLETSKSFAKRIMTESGVPTAAYKEFTAADSALAYAETLTYPQVIKADGLAAGKGVIIVKTVAEAKRAISELFAKPDQYKVLIEAFLTGEEFSLFTMVQGDNIVVMPVAQDHKRLADGDKGPNTGGMGAYSPVPHISAELEQTAIDQVVKPVLATMKANGTPFNGFLYSGLMTTADGIKVIEFNVRMGDPETQVVLPQMTSDFGTAIQDLLAGKTPTVTWQTGDFYLGTVIASRDYPRNVVNGRPLPEINNDQVAVSYAGVAKADDGNLVSHGGRVMMVTAKAADLKAAQQIVNRTLDADVDASAYTFRHDIRYHAFQ